MELHESGTYVRLLTASEDLLVGRENGCRGWSAPVDLSFNSNHALLPTDGYKVPLADRFSLSPEEASAITGIGLTSVREAINEGKLNAKKHGRRIVLLPDELLLLPTSAEASLISIRYTGTYSGSSGSSRRSKEPQRCCSPCHPRSQQPARRAISIDGRYPASNVRLRGSKVDWLG